MIDSDSKPKEQKRILIADDDKNIREYLTFILNRAGFNVIAAEDGAEAIRKLEPDVQVAILDNAMPNMTGIECIEELKHKNESIEIIMLAAGGVHDAVLAMNKGAFWYLQKPVESNELIALIKKAQEHSLFKKRNEELEEAIVEPSSSLNSTSTLLPEHLLAQLNKAADLDSSILIMGETGTGKSTLARYIHQKSKRKDGPFVSISCAAMPRDLFEAELFGYERGAFTGAVKSRPGRAEIAHGGTLFLDEIGDMPLDIQPKLLTFLEERIIHRLGSTKEKKIDIRLIAATLQDLDQMCGDKTFREDLYFRLKVFCFHIPPLRERIDEIPLLTRQLLDKLAIRYNRSKVELDKKALIKIMDYNWPGNIRELENCLERAIALTDNSIITSDLIFYNKNASKSNPKAATNILQLAGLPLSELEEQAIAQTLLLCNGSKKKAAAMLGISEKSIYNKIQRKDEKSLA